MLISVGPHEPDEQFHAALSSQKPGGLNTSELFHLVDSNQNRETVHPVCRQSRAGLSNGQTGQLLRAPRFLALLTIELN